MKYPFPTLLITFVFLLGQGPLTAAGTLDDDYVISSSNWQFHLKLKRIGWLYPIFRDVHFYHGLLGSVFCRAAVMS